MIKSYAKSHNAKLLLAGHPLAAGGCSNFMASSALRVLVPRGCPLHELSNPFGCPRPSKLATLPQTLHQIMPL